jgi:hypothetical protein
MLTRTNVRYSKSDICIAELILDSYGILIRNNALYDLMLNKLTVARFVGTGGFFLGYSNVHTK